MIQVSIRSRTIMFQLKQITIITHSGRREKKEIYRLHLCFLSAVKAGGVGWGADPCGWTASQTTFAAKL